jgi:LCP family protein required for cell wall assembly
LYVYIPGWYNNRINVAMEFGGFKTFQATMQQNFGFKPDHYVMTSFNGFKDAVNSLNGISVNASKKLTDRCDLRIQKRGICSVGPGPVTMDGDMALWYVRSRYSTSDFDRTRRAQEVIQAMFFRLMKKDAISRLPQLYKDFSSIIQTDMSLSDILPLAPFAQTITDPSKIRRFAVGPGEVYDWISPEGAMVLVPIQTNVMKVVRDTLNP